MESANPTGDFQTFIQAVEDGDLEEVRSSFQIDFLERITEDKYKQRPIHLACIYGHREIVEFLLEKKCEIECEDKDKQRPIHLACEKGRLDILKILIQYKCEIDCPNIDGITPMEIAVAKCKTHCSNFLNDVISLKNIFDTVKRKDVEAFKTFYNPSILTMEHDETGFSLLEVALESNANEIIDEILNKSVTTEEISILKTYLKSCGRPEPIQIIQECLLYRSIRFHDADGFHLSGLSKTINEHGKLVKSSFLEVAAEYNCTPFVPLLLKKTVYNEEEWTKAKNLAILKGNSEIAEAISNRISLLRKRADKNFTYLHSAVCDNDPEMVKYILEKNLVNPNSNNEVVGTALALAHMMCYVECIEVLEKCNVDVNTQNKYSQSPLHEAIASGMIDHCSYLINRVSDIDKPGFMGLTGLQCAVIEGCEKLCEKLLEKGGDCIRYVENLQQSAIKNRIIPISKNENAVTLCAKIHQKIYPCLLQALDSKNVKDSQVQSVMTKEIFHAAIPDADTKTLISLFGKSSATVQQSVIEDLLDHFSSKDNYNDFVNLLQTEIAAPKSFLNGETLFTNLLKQKKVKFCWTIINCERNKKCIFSANTNNETPLQICIESDLFDLMYRLILICDDTSEVGFNWNNPLILLFKKLSMSTNDEVDQKLVSTIKAIISKGGDIYQKTHDNRAIIDSLGRFREEIEKFQTNERPKVLDDQKIFSVYVDRDVNCKLDSGT